MRPINATDVAWSVVLSVVHRIVVKFELFELYYWLELYELYYNA